MQHLPSAEKNLASNENSCCWHWKLMQQKPCIVVLVSVLFLINVNWCKSFSNLHIIIHQDVFQQLSNGVFASWWNFRFNTRFSNTSQRTVKPQSSYRRVENHAEEIKNDYGGNEISVRRITSCTWWKPVFSHSKVTWKTPAKTCTTESERERENTRERERERESYNTRCTSMETTKTVFLLNKAT